MATIVGAWVAHGIHRDRQELTRLNLEVASATTRLHDTESRLVDASSRRAALEVEVEGLQKKVALLEERETRLNAVVEEIDPKAIIAKVKRQLGGRTPGERADSLWRRGQDAYDAGQLNLAEQLYEAAHEEGPAFAPALNGLGRIAADRGQLSVAEKFYTRAVQADPGYVHGLFNLASVNFLRRKYPEAERYARRALEVDPNYTKATALLKEIEKHK